LYLDGKNRAMLRSFRLCVGTLLETEELFWSQPPVAQQRLLFFIAGPLGLRFRAQYRDSQRAKARVWQLAIAIATTAAKHILFLLDLDYYMTMIS
jgi:hypothetical protein